MYIRGKCCDMCSYWFSGGSGCESLCVGGCVCLSASGYVCGCVCVCVCAAVEAAPDDAADAAVVLVVVVVVVVAGTGALRNISIMCVGGGPRSTLWRASTELALKMSDSIMTMIMLMFSICKGALFSCSWIFETRTVVNNRTRLNTGPLALMILIKVNHFLKAHRETDLNMMSRSHESCRILDDYAEGHCVMKA